MLDFLKPLLQLEQISPRLARKVWGLAPLLSAPFSLALGLKVNTLTDLEVEVALPATRQNRNEAGFLSASALIAAGELAGRLLWHRHLQTRTEELNLDGLELQNLRPVDSRVHARASWVEAEREQIMRTARMGERTTYDMNILFTDARDQAVGELILKWSLTPKQLVLGAGRPS